MYYVYKLKVEVPTFLIDFYTVTMAIIKNYIYI